MNEAIRALRILRNCIGNDGTLLIRPEASQAYLVDDGEKVESVLEYVDRVLNTQLEPMTMGLCETKHLILKADTLYEFYVIPGCKECAKLAAVYAPERMPCDPS